MDEPTADVAEDAPKAPTPRTDYDDLDRDIPHSGPFIVWGLALLVVGAAFSLYGRHLLDSWSSSDDAWIGFGIVFAATGIVLLPIGIYRAAAQLNAVYQYVRAAEPRPDRTLP